ncbi:Vitamin B12 ABC transporter, ATPase component BtuD [Salmonella enterica subsp. enterica serovar Montevideo str. S5-403]|uniref:Vitamin B12 ABC transporter, ATPase component BtuD n=1 Tax=Salmonella enterica subsp. enterica serovar Montevideo str. S5-403 TaxID=913242 RepID=G5Q3H1_SALMO|nr:Vitamin B12 ABC transporter, ATPase component BtuD [Salmonella enterica subsp. enterica serovar Montevideo str. S5-403]
MSQLMQLKDVVESTRLGPLSGEVSAGEILHLVGPNGGSGRTAPGKGRGSGRTAPGKARYWRVWRG